MQYPDFSNKVALVSGSSGGVGLRVAETLARNGATMMVHMLGFWRRDRQEYAR